jgi:hypothetical protein
MQHLRHRRRECCNRLGSRVHSRCREAPPVVRQSRADGAHRIAIPNVAIDVTTRPELAWLCRMATAGGLSNATRVLVSDRA